MKIAKIIALVGVIMMSSVILYALIWGNFSEEGSILMSMPWGIVSLVDLYTGFTLFAGWIIYREKSLLRAIIWIFFLMTLGFLIGALYTLLALQKSNNNWQYFWLGHRASS